MVAGLLNHASSSYVSLKVVCVYVCYVMTLHTYVRMNVVYASLNVCHTQCWLYQSTYVPCGAFYRYL